MTAPPINSGAFAATLRGQYDVEREIGRGGMGIVYLARDVRLDRPVAIKTLPGHLARDPAIRERFLREARTAAALSHPNIVHIHQADEVGDYVFFVMGFVDGDSLAHRVKSAGPLAPHDVIPILIDVVAALGYAHARGVVHRDIKAENILLDNDSGRAMVTDFGIARVAQSAPLTQTGTVLGTVHYMSPEQVAGEALDGRSDLYSLGVTAFHALTGRFPFESETPSAVLVAHVTRRAPTIRSIAPEVPVPIADVVDRLLLKEPVARYPDAESLLDALLAAQRTIPANAPPAQPVVLSSTEAHAVWERAALLQEMTGQVVPPPEVRRDPRRATPSETSGYRLAEVRDAAAEVGIGARYVDRALAERAMPTPASATVIREGDATRRKINPLVGAPTKLDFETIVDGELTEEDLEEIADEIRRSMGEIGSIAGIGRSLTWTSVATNNSGVPRRLQVSVSSRGGRTTVRGFEDLSQLTSAIFGGITGGVGASVGAATFGIIMGVTKGAVIIAGPAFAGVAIGAYGLARTIYGFTVRKRTTVLRTTIERVADRVRECIATRRVAPANTPRRIGR